MVRVGTDQRQSGGQVVGVKAIYQHPKHNGIDYDLALLELETSLTFSTTVQKVDLPEANEVVPTGSLALVAGWGYDKDPIFGGQLSNFLQGVILPVPSKLACKAIYPQEYTDRMICAGGPLGGKDACLVSFTCFEANYHRCTPSA